jgi:Zn finger protein HypA/HybF involved in hydrogenase expression
MIEKRNKKMITIEDNKVVYTCLICKRSFIGNMNTDITKCPSCKLEGNVVIDGHYIIRK